MSAAALMTFAGALEEGSFASSPASPHSFQTTSCLLHRAVLGDSRLTVV
jgi:hypothetical protein